ncbi:ComEC/Rec2 family competence protein [Streptomyces sp. NBC_01361]|uniref:ComEC/Rec2 family competence protein n=1 Tax=Streptomyces sp. NBC_01361 TaxID=2903838 RepID=UPI002E333686|nr:ComEC/Rec2 family competence protein [Streptomyces sp. NBC_01361]
MSSTGVAPPSDPTSGDANPRQEGPADLRLVPPALAAWATAAVTLDAPAAWVTALALTCAAVAGVLLLGGATRGRQGRTEPPSQPRSPAPLPPAPPSPESRPSPPRPPRRVFSLRPRMSVAAVLLCVAASGASAALHGADLTRGPVPGLARQFARVTVELEVTADPRLTRPRVKGDHAAPSSVVIAADVLRVGDAGRGGPSGVGTRVRTPVLVLVDVDRAAPGRTPWLSLLPSTRLVVHGGLAPASADGGRVAALLRVGRDEIPRIVGAPSTAQRFAGKLRGGLREATEGLPADARALLPGLVVGDTSRVPPELHEAFEATDLLHLTAVSGANFTILLALLIGPPGTAHRAERRGLAPRLGIPLRATALLGGALTLGFVIVCRPEPSVLRAAACGLVALLAIGTGRRRSLIPALATVVLLLVLYDPWLARSYGFLLSVLATGALLTLAPRWSAALRRRRCPPRLAEALAAAGAAQAVCAPVVVVIASRVSLVAVPCNLLAEFAVAPATVLGFAALAAAPLAIPVAKVFAWCASWPAGWIADIARAGAALPGGGVDWPGGPSGGLLLAVVTLCVVLVGRRVLKSPWAMGICVLLLILVVMQPRPLTRVITGWPPPGWRMVMCDVGQGDALVLAAGAGAGVVVDAGPDPVLVDRCLRSLGITRVPLVLLTHFHADHVAGLPGVLRGREVGAIETTGFDEPPEQARFVRGLAHARHITMTRAVAGEERRTGRLAWQVLWPPPRPAPDPDGPNDASVTLLVRTAGLTLLLLGDLEPPAQRALLRSPVAAALPPVDVLKVAHHGSAYQDPVLLRRVAPRLALISCGEDNPYGHPSARTVAELRAGGAAVLRTDRDGALAVTGSGQDRSGSIRSGEASGERAGEGAGLGVVTGGS